MTIVFFMQFTQYQPLFFILLLFVLYFVSRQTINHMFHALRLFIKNEKSIFAIISFIFFPGTVIHEMAHFFMAIILMLKVRGITIFPTWENGYIKLGSVVYEKGDYIRGVLVGIAPIIVGLLCFWWISVVNIFPSDNFSITIALGYLIFVISSTMFSSKQDLVDLIFLIPFIILGFIIMYIFDINIRIPLNGNSMRIIAEYMQTANTYLMFSIGIQIGVLALLQIVKIIKKHA